MGTNSTARRHHYLPQAYLAAFTSTGSKGDQLCVFDIHSRHPFRTSLKNVAIENDFNRINIEGVLPDAIEQALAPFEQQAVTAIRNVLKREEFPDDEDYIWILNLIGLIAVHNPSLRNSFNHSLEQVGHCLSDLLVSDKNIWEQYVKKAREVGETIIGDVSFEDMKRSVEDRKYRIEVPTEKNLHVEFRAFGKLLPILFQRTWSVLVAPKDGPEFICSDHPVTLFRKRRMSDPVGYASKETEVFFPLGRRIGFYGVFEAPLPPVVTLQPEHVGRMNRRVEMNAERHVFSALQSFFVWHKGQIREVVCV